MIMRLKFQKIHSLQLYGIEVKYGLECENLPVV